MSPTICFKEDIGVSSRRRTTSECIDWIQTSLSLERTLFLASTASKSATHSKWATRQWIRRSARWCKVTWISPTTETLTLPLPRSYSSTSRRQFRSQATLPRKILFRPPISPIIMITKSPSTKTWTMGKRLVARQFFKKPQILASRRPHLTIIDSIKVFRMLKISLISISQQVSILI